MMSQTSLKRCFLGLCCLLVLPLLLHCGTEECYYDTDCAVGQVCQKNVCQDTTIASCKKDSECKKGQKCISQRCVFVPAGFEFPAKPEPTAEPSKDGGEMLVDGELVPPDGENIAKGDGNRSEEPVIEKKPLTKCKTVDDCTKDEVCVLGGAEKKELVCQPKNKSGLAFGSKCDPKAKLSECISLFCHPQNKVCTNPCVADTQCPGGKGSCELLTGRSFKVCKGTDSNRKCLRDADCGTGQICGIVDDGGNSILSCSNPKGTTLIGKPCISSSECYSNACVDGICSRPCRNDVDCPDQFLCGDVTIPHPDPNSKKYTFRLCHLPKEGIECKLDKNCLRKDFKCTPSNINNAFKLRCRFSGGTAPFGGFCSKDSDCISGFCLASGLCSQVCSISQDCPNGKSAECHDLLLEKGGAKGKVKGCLIDKLPCKSTLDCNRGEICSPVFVQERNDYSLRCVKPFTSRQKVNGTSCLTNTDCQSLFCKNTICSACKHDADCGAGLTCTQGRCPSSKKPDGSFCRKNENCQSSFCKSNRCSTCQNNADCSAGEVCFQGRCHATKSIGGDCTKNADCLSMTCVNKKCSQPCTTLKECQSFHLTCETASLTKSNATLKAQFCVVPQGGLPCASNKDCPSVQEGECHIVEIKGEIKLRCRAKSGSKQVGESCTKSSDCRSGSCLMPEGLCSRVCATNADCPTGKELLCLEREFKSSTNKILKTKVCSPEPCDGDADCKTSQKCIYQNNNGNGSLRCYTPNSAKKKQGEACSSDADCQSQLCRKSASGNVCASPCFGGNTAVCPLGFVCEKTASGTNGTHLCIPQSDFCERDADCSGGKICTLSFDAGKRPVRKCSSPLGTEKNGEVCHPKQVPTSCRSGFCDPLTSRCSTFCKSATDCVQAEHKCSPASFKNASGQSGADWTLNYCRSTICFYDGNCQKGESCNVRIIKGVPVKRCVKTVAGKPGDSCATSSDCSSGLCSGSVCLAACSAHRHCSSTQVCNKINILPGISSFGCVRGRRTSCSGSADCASGEVCQAYITPGGAAKTKCKKPLATDKSVGQACDPTIFPSQCASGLCDSVTKVCLKVCRVGLQGCKIGMEICGKFPLLKTSFNACIPTPKSCQKQSDCRLGLVCVTNIENGKPARTCLRPNGIETKKVGQTCDPGISFPGFCQTHLCHPTLRVCANTCQADADCPTGRPVCGHVLVKGVSVNVCTESKARCRYDADCPTSEPVCALEISGRVVSTRCGKGGTGSKKVGESCDSSKKLPGDCINRFCEAGTNLCVAACSSNAQCPKGLVCDTTFVEGSLSVRGCVKPIGAPCVRLSDCPKPKTCSAQRRTSGIIAACEGFKNLEYGKPCSPEEVTKGSGNYKFSLACNSRICHNLSKLCTSVCQTDADCPTGKCQNMLLEGYQVKVCNASCSSSKDCPSGEVCGASFVGITPNPTCVKTDPKLKPIGASCDPSKLPFSVCQTGFCSPATSTCTDFCKVDTDCASGQICDITFIRYALGLSYATTKACVPSSGSCRYQGDCFNSYICEAVNRNGKMVTSCATGRPTGHALDVGCDPKKAYPGDCKTNICAPVDKRCTSICRTDADCKFTRRSKCGIVTVNGASIPACVKK